jgi:hypothetical protein
MRKLIITLIPVILLVNFCFPVSVDLKTKFAEKVELLAVKKGTEVYLEKKGISVVEGDEDFAVWLKNFERLYKGNNRYSYNLTVKLSYPTTFVEKKAVKEKVIHFEISLGQPIPGEIETLERYFGNVSDKVEKRRKREAYIGGKAAADCIEEFLESLGVLR